MIRSLKVLAFLQYFCVLTAFTVSKLVWLFANICGVSFAGRPIVSLVSKIKIKGRPVPKSIRRSRPSPLLLPERNYSDV